MKKNDNFKDFIKYLDDRLRGLPNVDNVRYFGQRDRVSEAAYCAGRFTLEKIRDLAKEFYERE